MANTEEISSYIDQAAIKSQTDFFLSQLQSLKKAYEDINSSSITLKGASSTKDLASGLNDVAAASKNATKAQDDLSKARINAEKLAQQQLKTEQQVIKVIREEERAQQDILKSQKARLAEQEKAGKVSASEAKLIEQASNEYLQLGRALQDAELKYKNLYLTQGKDNEQTQVALKNALAIRNVLNTVDQSLGNYQRQVGNYAAGFGGLNTSIQQILREAPSAAVSLNTFFLAISNNLPMFFDEVTRIKKAQEEAVVIAKEAAAVAKAQASAQALQAGATAEAAAAEGLLAEQTALANSASAKAPSVLKQIGSSLLSVNTFLTLGVLALTLFGGKIVEWVGSLFGAQAAVNRLKEAHASLIETMNSAAKSSADEIVNLRVLEKAATDVSKPMSVRLQAVKDLKEEYPKYLEGISNEAILHGQAAVQINLVADALYKKAFAEAASSKAAAIAGSQLDLELRRNFLINETTRAQLALNKARADNVTDENGVNQAALSEEKHLKELNTLLGKNTEQYNANGKQIKFFTDKAAENFDVVKKLEVDDKAPQVKTVTDAVKELRKELEAIGGRQVLGEITPKEADIERVKAYNKAFEDIFKRGGKVTTPIVQQLSVELNPISIRVMEDEIKTFAQKNHTTIDLLPPKEDVASKVKDYTAAFAEGEAKFYEEVSSRQLVVLQTQEANEKAALEKRFSTGVIGKVQYENELLAITEKYGRLQLEIQAKWLQEEIKLLPFGTKSREDAEKKLAELRILLNKRVLTDEQRTFQERARMVEDFISKAQKVAGELSNLVGGLVNNSVTSQKNAIQDLENSQQSQYESEIARINASGATEQQKHDLIANLDATRTAQKQKNERDQRQADMERARFEKAANLTRIAVETALAVVHQLGTGDPFTAFARAFAVGALGAAEFAIAASAPLAKFKHGKSASNKFEGFAEVGDGNVHEVIQRDNGNIEVTPDRSTVTYLKRNDIVYPSIEAYRNKVAMSQTDRVLSNGMLVQQVPVLDIKPLERKMDGVIHAIHNKPSNETVWTERGVITRVKNGFSETEYINRYVKGM